MPDNIAAIGFARLTNEKGELIDPGTTGEGGEDTLVPGDPVVDPNPTDDGHEDTTASDDGLDPQEKRIRYWQSKADQERMRVRELERLAEIGRQALVERTQAPGLSPVSGQSRQVDTKKLEAPKPPVKPADFNDDAAFNDPSSASYKYRVAKDNWRDEMLLYHARKEDLREQERERERQLHAQEAAMQDQIRQTKALLVGKYKMTEAQAVDFIETMRDPSSVSMDNLVRLYKLGRQTQPTKTKTSLVDQLERQRKSGQPLPPIDGGEPSDKTLSDNDMFSLGLMAGGKRK